MLTCESGRSGNLLNKFYDLLIRTRRRHGLPPQPRRWFRNLISCMGESLTIRVASKDAVPVASILTLRFKNTIIYKYGCSDERFFNLGGMQLLLWQTISDAKQSGAEELDLGRSDPDDEGLIVFKNRWGAKSSLLTYFRSPVLTSRPIIDVPNWSSAKRLSSHIPSALSSTAARVLYRHFG
jgi:lipid II:glycine glycyltransferase (peptidoglycan interpeptide bridge formation enzyme)